MSTFHFVQTVCHVQLLQTSDREDITSLAAAIMPGNLYGRTWYYVPNGHPTCTGSFGAIRQSAALIRRGLGLYVSARNNRLHFANPISVLTLSIIQLSAITVLGLFPGKHFMQPLRSHDQQALMWRHLDATDATVII